ncbi:Ferredoxin-type protein NapG (periplasmic nitrate reductase) [hydrothermal vent metagenome]|uniref:Ferredoxin-type protein NapG (Periplasmic nitrate reductase) n=1 Tax=hydrothermal vent metagenome TaxID=652676 RepID=A0A3B0YH88_9ZZZZ
MDRRAFFSRSAGKVAQTVTKHAAEKARKNAANWIRPPFAIEELDFLLACNRCGDCTDACPHHIIFPLPATLGAKVFATPALDLKNHGCHLCEDWPCVQACETKALLIPDESAGHDTETEEQSLLAEAEGGEPNDGLVEEIGEIASAEEINSESPELLRLSPVIAVVSINTKTCLPYSGPECGACRVCPIEGAMSWDMEKPKINPEFCIGCALCREACIVEPKAINVQSKYKALE